MAKTIEFEATAPDGTKVKFRAPENTPEDLLKKYALIEYQMRTTGRSEYIRDDVPPGTLPGAAGPAITEPPMPPPEPPAPSEPPTPGVDPMADLEARLKAAEGQQEIRQAQLMGGAAGAGIGGARVGAELAGRAAQSLGERSELGRISARQATGTPNTPEQIARILQGTPGETAGTTGRARTTGFNIETAQQAARAREGEQVLGGLQQRGMVGRNAPQVLADMPGMTSSPSGVIYPRAAEPPVTVPPRPSGLDQASSLFKSLMGPVATAARFATPPLALAAAAGEGIRARQLMQQEQPDPTGAALSGTVATSGLAALSPRLAPAAIPIGLSAGALQYMRGRLSPDEPVSPSEEELASRPAFGYYPHLGRRRPRAVLP